MGPESEREMDRQDIVPEADIAHAVADIVGAEEEGIDPEEDRSLLADAEEVGCDNLEMEDRVPGPAVEGIADVAADHHNVVEVGRRRSNLDSTSQMYFARGGGYLFRRGKRSKDEKNKEMASLLIYAARLPAGRRLRVN